MSPIHALIPPVNSIAELGLTAALGGGSVDIRPETVVTQTRLLADAASLGSLSDERSL